MLKTLAHKLGLLEVAELVPPIQNDQGQHYYPEQLPHFRFITAQITGTRSDPTVDVSRSYPSKDTDRYDNLREIEEKYIVQVPEFDGDIPVNVEFDERSRRTNIAISSELGTPSAAGQFQYYSVSVPYTRYVEGGMKINQSRLEIRKRNPCQDELVLPFVPKIITSRHRLDALECYSVTGKRLSSRQIRWRLRSVRPALLVNDPDSINPYFAKILTSNCVIIVDGDPGQAIEQTSVAG